MLYLCFCQASLPLAGAGESLVQTVRIRRLNTFHALKLYGGHCSSGCLESRAKIGVCSACSIYDCTIDGGHHSNANVLVGLLHDTCGTAHYQQWAAAKSELILGVKNKKPSAAVVVVQNSDCPTAVYLHSLFRHHLFQSSMQNSNMASCSFFHRGDE